MGETHKDGLRVDFDHSVKLEFHGSTVSSADGLPTRHPLAHLMKHPVGRPSAKPAVLSHRFAYRAAVIAAGRSFPGPENGQIILAGGSQGISWRCVVGGGLRPRAI